MNFNTKEMAALVSVRVKEQVEQRKLSDQANSLMNEVSLQAVFTVDFGGIL